MFAAVISCPPPKGLLFNTVVNILHLTRTLSEPCRKCDNIRIKTKSQINGSTETHTNLCNMFASRLIGAHRLLFMTHKKYACNTLVIYITCTACLLRFFVDLV